MHSIHFKKWTNPKRLITLDKQANKWQGQRKHLDYAPLLPECPEGIKASN